MYPANDAPSTDGIASQTNWRSDGLKQAETAPDGSVRRYAYDAAGRLSQATDEHNRTITYDSIGRPLRQTSPNGGQTTRRYDANGTLTSGTASLPLS